VSYKKLVDNLEAKNDALKLGIELTRELYPAERELQKLKEGASDYSSVKTSAEYKRVKALLDERLQLEINADLEKQRIKDEKTYSDALANSIKKTSDEADALLEKANALDKMSTSRATAIAELKRTEEQIIKLRDKAGSSANDDGSARRDYDIAGLVELQKQQQRVVDAYDTIAGKSLDEKMTKLFDPTKVKTFGDVMKDTFGDIGKGFATAAEGMKRYQVAMDKVAKTEKLAKEYREHGDPLTYQLLMKKAAIDTAEAEVVGYADMAGAAKAFFKEKTAGYQIMSGAEQAFRAYSMAAEISDAITKSTIWATLTAEYAAQKGAMIATDTAHTATSVANSGMRAAADGVAAVAKSLASLPFPFNIAAGAATLAALIAVGVKMTGSVDGKTVDPGNTGTGTSFGDVKKNGQYQKQSESLTKSLELLGDVDTATMRYSAQMASSLKNIESNIGGLTNILIRSNASTAGSVGVATGYSNVAFSNLLGSIGSGIINGVGRLLDPLMYDKLSRNVFNTKTTITGQGIYGKDQSLGSVMSDGYDAAYYADVHKRSKLFGITVSDKNSTKTIQEGTSDLDNRFSLILKGFAGAIKTAAVPLEQNLNTVQSALESYVVSIGKINLKDLTGEEIQEKLTAVFGAEADKIAAKALPGFEAFMHAGEGYFETVVRVSSGVEQATTSLKMLGVEAVNYGQITEKQGDVAAEIVRQSLVGLETTRKASGTFKFFGMTFTTWEEKLSGVGEILKDFNGTADELLSTYKALISARKAMARVGFNTDLNRDLIIAGGGLDVLSDSLESYFDNFFTDSEKLAAKTAEVRSAFASLGMAMPASTKAYRELVESLVGSGQADTAARVLGLSDAFAELFNDVGSYDNLLSDAKSALKDAYERESDALQDVIDKFKDFSKTLGDFAVSLMTGESSPLTTLDQYKYALGQYSGTYSKAMSGDETAISEFQDAAQKFLDLSRTMYASGDQYTADFYKVLEQTQALEEFTAGRVSVAEQQLEQLKTQVSALIDINESVKTVAQAIYDLQYLSANGKMPVDGSHASGLSYVPFDGYIAELHKGERVLTASENKSYSIDYSQYGRKSDEALVSEIKALRAEVSSLRSEQAQQTGALISANYDANERNAKAVVEGVNDSARSSSYQERARPTLA
jgi:hypothetical protein